MSECKFGERYFATRERLSNVMRGIADLAKETATALDDHLPLADLEHGLGNPFTFVVCGETYAGKSTLLNGLFGSELCQVDAPPDSHPICHYRFGNPRRDVAITPRLETRFRPTGFLRDFHLIDTPGTNSQNPGHEELTARYLPTADLLLFVFPVSNPWGAATWNFISSLPAEDLDRSAFILQQTDQRDPAEIQVILGHMADLSIKRVGRVVPIFPVSAKLAYELKSQPSVSHGQLKASGWLVLEDFIAKKVCYSPARRKALETWRRQAATGLQLVDDRIEEQTRALNSQHRFLQEVEREIHDIREQFVTRLPRHLAGVAEVFESEGIWVTKRLHRRLRALPSLFRIFTGDRTGAHMESVFIERLQAAVEAVAANDGTEVVEACEAHRHDLGARVKDAMGVDLAAAEPITETLATAKTHFVTSLGRAARQGIDNLKVRNQLDKDLRRRNRALRSFMSTCLVLTSAGATSGALAVAWLPTFFCGLAGLFLVGGIVTAWKTRKAITREFQQRLVDTCGSYASALQADYEEALRVVFHDYAGTLSNVRTHLARENLAVEPRVRRWQELFLTLKAIEQDL